MVFKICERHQGLLKPFGRLRLLAVSVPTTPIKNLLRAPPSDNKLETVFNWRSWIFVPQFFGLILSMSRKGTYSITNVLHLIRKNSDHKRTLSVPSPTAQTSDLCASGTGTQDLEKQISSALNYWERSWPIMYRFATFQLYSGARVSEILRLHSNDITTNGRVLIRPLKGGNPRIVQIPDLTEWMRSEKPKGRYLFRDLTRFVIHREYVKQGISAHFGSNMKRSTTHLFRHLVGLDLKQINGEENATRIGLGQKTDKAADHYKVEVRR